MAQAGEDLIEIPVSTLSPRAIEQIFSIAGVIIDENPVDPALPDTVARGVANQFDKWLEIDRAEPESEPTIQFQLHREKESSNSMYSLIRGGTLLAPPEYAASLQNMLDSFHDLP